MSNKGLVSIIIANYNNSRYIQSTLDSVILQTYKQIQLIIVDDGSSDDSISIINDFIQSNKESFWIDSLLLKINIGSGFAKSKGLELVKGEFCCFLDSDDWLPEHSIMTVVDALEDNPYLAMIYTNAFKIDAFGNTLGLLNYARDGSDLLNDRVCFHLAIWRMKYYNELQNKFDGNYYIAYDIDLYMKIEEIGDVLFINEPLYYYRVHNNNISIGYDRFGHSFVERIITRWEAQKRRGEIDTRILGKELQQFLDEQIKKKQKTFTIAKFFKKLKSYTRLQVLKLIK